MSLKSKLEAVIYAAEEPVTLGQLTTLFGAEALEWKATQEAAARKAASDASATAVDPSQPMIAEGLEYLKLRTEDGTLIEQPGLRVLPVVEPEAGETTGTGAELGQADSPDAQVSENAEETPAEGSSAEPGSAGTAQDAAAPDPEAEAKRIARQRDRDIKAVLRQLIEELIVSYENDDRGVEIREIAGGYRMATKPECHDAVRMFIKSLKPALKLSLPALETLAVIAYKQPVTAPEVNEIRGVDSSGVFGSLLARKLITTAGRKQVIGRPILYKTTKEFLLRFGLKDVSELPSMEEFEKMAATELEMEPEVVEADKAAEAAEAGADPGGETGEQSSETDLESNSPGEEEFAGTMESVQ